MSTVSPHWHQPSHPEIQEVIVNDGSFMTKSFSKVSLPPFAVFAKMDFPPCTLAVEPSYATVQFSKNQHLNLNSDLLYINHSCEPSLIFDTGNSNILVGPNGLQPEDELTFFYPSTEWVMAQPFTCQCGKPTCRGTISGAKDMTASQLEGTWLNGHIRKLLEEHALQSSDLEQRDLSENDSDPTAQGLRIALEHAEKVADAARLALRLYAESTIGKAIHPAGSNAAKKTQGTKGVNTNINANLNCDASGLERRGLTSRELSGEMGGDTSEA